MSVGLPKILLVEDDDILLEINSTKLAMEDFELETATNGREALAKLETFTPDIILLDMMMPVMDGPQFMREFRKRGHESMIIIFSNISSPESTREVMALGASEYLNKSRFTPDELVTHLKEVWERHEVPKTSAPDGAAGTA